ncbi:hypothetical protein, partial [Brevibacillus sp. SIMBA_040]|uniref:hypothetical protein n=1 Tax=Brevibacillus sp. SIMBA_040 TaxID=3085781 RepID=UPI0039788D32
LWVKNRRAFQAETKRSTLGRHYIDATMNGLYKPRLVKLDVKMRRELLPLALKTIGRSATE